MTNAWSNRRWMFSFMFFRFNWMQSKSTKSINKRFKQLFLVVFDWFWRWLVVGFPISQHMLWRDMCLFVSFLKFFDKFFGWPTLVVIGWTFNEKHFLRHTKWKMLALVVSLPESFFQYYLFVSSGKKIAVSLLLVWSSVLYDVSVFVVKTPGCWPWFTITAVKSCRARILPTGSTHTTTHAEITPDLQKKMATPLARGQNLNHNKPRHKQNGNLQWEMIHLHQ